MLLLLVAYISFFLLVCGHLENGDSILVSHFPPLCFVQCWNLVITFRLVVILKKKKIFYILRLRQRLSPQSQQAI